MRLLPFFLIILLSVPGHAQNSAVTDFNENHETALSLYFYPSTLRMVNIERNPEFDEMIREIKKARFFKFDSGNVSMEDIKKFVAALTEEGFEDLMEMKSRGTNLSIWGVEKRIPELILISKSNEEIMLLEVSGMINIAKLPKLAETFSQNSFLDVLQLNNQKK